MIEAAERSKVKLMIAYRLHFEKGNLSAIETIRRGKIGEPRIFTSSFCQQVAPGNSRLDGDLGGGPLYDIGVYCINASRYLFRAEPEATHSNAKSYANATNHPCTHFHSLTNHIGTRIKHGRRGRNRNWSRRCRDWRGSDGQASRLGYCHRRRHSI
jgi:predicted dehydrogenase